MAMLSGITIFFAASIEENKPIQKNHQMKKIIVYFEGEYIPQLVEGRGAIALVVGSQMKT